MGNGPVAADELRLLIERVERLEEEKKGIADDIKDVYAEAKSRGFCPKTMRRVIALRKLEPDERREMEAMLDLYKGALGMLDGTPLGNWAIERLKREPKKPEDPEAAEEPQDAASAAEDASDAAEDDGPVDPLAGITVDDARRLGGEAARAGEDVTRNPFPAGDRRRAAWDEAWCQELGSDGMDIPAALRPASTRKPKSEGEFATDASLPEGSASEPVGDGADDEEAESIDPLYESARLFVLDTQAASVSKLQRRYEIGYNRATRIMEALQTAGVVSAPSENGRREVLLGRPDGPATNGGEA